MLFEKPVRCLPFTFDTLQVADRANRSREDAIVIAIHNTISDLEAAALCKAAQC